MTSKTIERKDLVAAVLASRDKIDPDLETELLEAIVDAEWGSGGDSDAATAAINAALSAAIGRGVGNVQARNASAATDGTSDSNHQNQGGIA